MPSKPASTPKRPRGRPPVAEQHPLDDSVEMFTMLEVAKHFRLSVDTISRMVHGTEDKPPELSHIRVGGNIRIPREAIAEYKARNTTVAGAGKVSAATRQRMGMR